MDIAKSLSVVLRLYIYRDGGAGGGWGGGDFNKTIITLALDGYEIIIANLALHLILME